MFVPDKVQLPVPVLVKLVTPVLLAKTGASTPVPVPANVSVRVDVPLYPKELVLPKLNVPVPEASSVPPLSVSVNNRSIVAPEPVYFSVPPSRTRLAATLEDAPILLLDPPLVREDTLKVPPEIVVTPV